MSQSVAGNGIAHHDTGPGEHSNAKTHSNLDADTNADPRPYRDAVSDRDTHFAIAAHPSWKSPATFQALLAPHYEIKTLSPMLGRGKERP